MSFAKPFFYKRKLANFNFTVYDTATKNGYCYFWNETEGKREANEIATCLMRFLDEIPVSVKQVSMFSDCCPGQNRNSILPAMLNFVVKNSVHLESVELKFLQSGHTMMECDSMHSTIETKSHKSNVMSPGDWVKLIKNARKGQPYSVKELSYHDFVDWKLMRDSNTPNFAKANLIQWSLVKHVRFDKAHPDQMFFKYRFTDEEFKVVDVGSSRTKPLVVKLPKLYDSLVKLKWAKYNDLKQLCESGLIERYVQPWYLNLPHENAPGVEDDIVPSPIVPRTSKISKPRKTAATGKRSQSLGSVEAITPAEPSSSTPPDPSTAPDPSTERPSDRCDV